MTYDKKKNVIALQADNKLIFQFNDFIIGESGYWYYRWASTHPKGVDSLCGSYTLLSKSNIKKFVNKKYGNWKEIYVCEISILNRENSYGEFKKIKKLIILES
jgi:hypothetical protein